MIFKKLRSYFPEKLPQTELQLAQYLDRVFHLCGIPRSRSYEQAVATMIMQMPGYNDSKSVNYFVKCIKRRRANEAAYALLQEIRVSEKAEEEAKIAAELAKAKNLNSTEGENPLSGKITALEDQAKTGNTILPLHKP